MLSCRFILLVLAQKSVKGLVKNALDLHAALELLDDHRVLVCLKLLLHLGVEILDDFVGNEQVAVRPLLHQTESASSTTLLLLLAVKEAKRHVSRKYLFLQVKAQLLKLVNHFLYQLGQSLLVVLL